MRSLKDPLWVVSSKDEGERLQAFLKGKLESNASGKRIKGLIDAYGCRVNGRVELFASYRLRAGDRVQIDKEKLGPKERSCLVKILYEDEDLYVVDKPSGISSELSSFQKALQQDSLFLVHRLDKETSGVMLLAKNAFMQKLLEVLFKKRKLQKVYHALVEGRVSTRVFTVENKLGKRCVYEGQALWGELDQGLVALTHFEVIQEKNHHALVHCEPVTGRTHQIRVHLAGQKLPILGDYHYHRETPFAYKASRVLLHAYSLTLQHPKTHKRLSIQSPYPQDFNKALLDLFS